MGQIGFSRWRGTTGDAAHRPRVATHAKSQYDAPQTAFLHPVASFRSLACAPNIARRRGPSHGLQERGQTDPIKARRALWR